MPDDFDFNEAHAEFDDALDAYIEQQEAEASRDVPPTVIEEVRVMRLQPGDIVVARVGEGYNPAGVEAARYRLTQIFPGHQVLVVSGAELSVVRPDPLDGERGGNGDYV